MSKLHLVFGGRVKDPQGLEFVDLEQIDDRFVAFSIHAWVSTNYRLFLFDLREQKIVWETEVFCEDLLFFAGSGTGYPHWTEIVFDQEGQIIVFGASNQSMYIEAFDRQTGKVRFRFSTSY